MTPRLLESYIKSHDYQDGRIDFGKQVEVRLGPLSDPQGITFLLVDAEVDKHGRLILIAREVA